jgi:alcohol dehydrogenase
VLGEVPEQILITTGMNALHHCSEGLYSKSANPVSDSFAVEGARRLGLGLRAVAGHRAVEADYAALGEGAALGGLALSNARVAIGHAACHVLGARFHMPHGVANSIMLPASYRFNQAAARSATERFAEALGEEPAQFVSEIGAPSRLRDHEIRREDLPGLAEALMGERGVYFNPRPVRGPEDALELFELAW